MAERQAPPTLEGNPLSITQEGINRYARLSNDFNPLHVDLEYARSTPFGGTIAHGTINLAPVLEAVARVSGQAWPTGAEVSVKFVAPAKPGDTLTPAGSLAEEQGEPGTATYEVICRNQQGQDVLVGTARVRVG